MVEQDHRLAGRKIVLALGGGVAAYKSAVLASQLVQRGADVFPVMTESAQAFLGTSTLAALCGRPVATAVFAPESYPLGAHIEVAAGADLMVVAPATADLIGCFANGLANNLVTTLFLQRECPVLVAPAMSNLMWSKPSVQRNVDTLKHDGLHFVGPEVGWLSCRQQGAGRMSEPETIMAGIMRLLADET